MALTVPDVGETLAAAALVTKEDYSLRLFTNDWQPGESDDDTDYVEATGGGYAAKTLDSGSWSVASSVASYAPQVWTFTAGGPAAVYGYYLVGVTSGVLLLADRFWDGPYDADVSGTTITVTLQIAVS